MEDVHVGPPGMLDETVLLNAARLPPWVGTPVGVDLEPSRRLPDGVPAAGSAVGLHG